MISVPDIGHVYPKTGLDADIRFDTTPSFVSSGSCLFSSTYLEADGIQISSASDWSVACWVRASSSATGTYQYLIDVSKASSQRVILYLGSNGDFGHWGTGDSSPTEFGDATVIRDGTWHHVCFTVSGGTSAKVYVDGELNGSATITSQDLSASSGTCDIGGTSSSSYLFDNGSGSLCHLGFWNAELTQAEIRLLMTATTYAEAVSKSGNTPAHYWIFESDLNASVGGVNADASSGGATIVGDRARLPSGLDLSGNRRDARLHSGRCLSFDGSGGSDDDFALGDSYSDSSNYFTLSLWVEQESTASGRGIFTNGPDAADVEHGLLYTTGSGELRWYFQDGTAKQYVEADTSLQADTFHHVVITVDGSDSSSFDVCMYLDGKLQDKTKAAGGFSLADGLAIGCEYHASNGANLFWYGSIADVKIFNVELTAAQALEMYSNPEQILPTGVSSSALKRWYPCSDFEITGAELLDDLYLQDCSGNNKPLKISGCAMEVSRPDTPQLALRSSSSRIYFDQTDDKVSISGSSDTGSTFAGGGTIAGWFFAFSDGEFSNGLIIDMSANYHIKIDSESSGTCDLTFIHNFDNTSGDWKISGVNIGQWNHFAVTYNSASDSNDPVIYLNGSTPTVTESVTPDGTAAGANSLITIGNEGGAARTFHGFISELSLYKGTILDSDAVAAVYNSGVQGFDLLTDSGDYDQSSNLDGWWKLDDPVTIEDLSTNSNTGTVSGTPAMATVPEGTTADLSVFGSLTTTQQGPGMFCIPPQASVTGKLGGSLIAPQVSFGTENFTMGCWIKSSAYTDGYQCIWQFSPGNNRGVRCLITSATTIQFDYEGATTNDTLSFTISSLIENWTFVAFQRLGAASFKGWARKISDSAWTSNTESVDVGDMTDSGTGDCGWGIRTDSDGNNLNGSLAFPRIWLHGSNAAWSESELNAVFEQGKRFLIGDL